MTFLWNIGGSSGSRCERKYVIVFSLKITSEIFLLKIYSNKVMSTVG